MGLLTRLLQLGRGETGRCSLPLRLYRMRFVSAFIVVLPLLFLCVWYAAAAYTAHLRYNAASGQDEPLTLETFHVHLHDRLTRDLRRASMPEPAGRSKMPTYSLVMGNAELSTLDAKVPPEEGAAAYVKAYLRKGTRGEVKTARVRYRGRKHWHWNYAQKSWKIRLKAGSFLDGLETFSFLNTVEPLPIDEQIVLDVARAEGLLTPEHFPFRLLLNNAYMGVYFFSSEPDEGFLRNARRIPGSIYSGNQAPKDKETGVSALWSAAKYWKKVAARFPELMEDNSELTALIAVVDQGSQEAFARFARDHIDVEAFARFDALDVVFGSNQHDFGQNHKLYFDPYRGRFEPIAWNFRGWTHRRRLNRTENPLLLRLKDLPKYLSLRNRIVRELLESSCSLEAVKAKAKARLAELARDQASDPYWSAYDLLPKASKYLRQMVRPMNEERQAIVLASRMAEYERRVAYLGGELDRVSLDATLAAGTQPALDQGEAATPAPAILDLVVDGMAGLRLRAIEASWDPACTPGDVEIVADTNLSGAFEVGQDRVLTPNLRAGAAAPMDEALYPGNLLTARKKIHNTRGGVRARPEARSYRLFIRGEGCVPRRVELRAESLVSGRELRATAGPGHRSATPPRKSERCADDLPPMTAGHRSLHPWCLTPEPAEEIQLGPGVVHVEDQRVFGAQQRVVIAPGTTLVMGSQASLIFQAQLSAEGSPEAPIRIMPREGSWGGVALQGPGCAGSRWRHVEVSGGTTPSWGLTSYPGMVNVHDSRDVAFEDCRFGENQGSDDVLHVAFVEDFVLSRVQVVDSADDGVDLEFSSAKLSDLRVVGAGDECLDLMGSEVALERSVLLECQNNGVSAGEETRLNVVSSLIAESGRGLLAKNASVVGLDGALLYGNKTGLQVEPVSERYEGRSRVKAATLHVVGSEEIAVVKKRKGRKKLGGAHKLKGVDEILTALGEDALQTLGHEVLGLEAWSELDAGLGRMKGELRR